MTSFRISNKQPYYRIEIHLDIIHGINGSDDGEWVRITLDEDGLYILQEHDDLQDEFKGFDLSFTIETALELRDFLNFALPIVREGD